MLAAVVVVGGAQFEDLSLKTHTKIRREFRNLRDHSMDKERRVALTDLSDCGRRREEHCE